MENFEKSWKRSWQVMEFQKPNRVQTLINFVKGGMDYRMTVLGLSPGQAIVLYCPWATHLTPRHSSLQPGVY